jgi:Fibronectin type III domain
VRRFSPRVVYASAGLAVVLALTVLGMNGHGLPALGMQLRSGQAWLANLADHTISYIDGYSGEVVGQVADPGGTAQVVNTPEGAVVVGKNGHLISVSNDNFTTSGSVELLGGGLTAAAGAQNALYAVNEATGQIQQLDASNSQLPPIGPPVSVGAPIVTPVVAPDGSLYVGIPRTGSVGHVSDDRLDIIKGVARPDERLAVMLAGTQPVAADLTAGVVMPLGATAITGRGVQLPGTARPVAQVTGSDSLNGLVGVVGPHAVDSASVTTGAVSTTPLPSWFRTTGAAMEGQDVVLIDTMSRDLLFVDTANQTTRTLTMPGNQPPDQVTVQDGLIFVNAADGPDAMVINGDGQWKPVTKYNPGQPPPRPKPATLPPPTPTQTPPPSVRPPRKPVKPVKPGKPGAPANPTAVAGNAMAQVSWGPAAPNGSPITRYLLAWTGNGPGGTIAAGTATVPGTVLGKTVDGLVNGDSYTFTIQAQNGVGRGPVVTTTPVTPSSTVPAVPTDVRASTPTDNGEVSLTWTEPANGDQIKGYTVAEAGTTTAVQGQLTGTTFTTGPLAPDAAGQFLPVRFTVTAVDTSGHVSTASVASNAVTPFLAPQAPDVDTNDIMYAQDGKSASLTVSCDATCQQGGAVKAYKVSLGGSVVPVTASGQSDGSATQVQVDGLAPNTSYTAEVTVEDQEGVWSQPTAVSLFTFGPPTVTAATVSPVTVGLGAAPEVDVAATVNPGGEQSSCVVSISLSNGGGSQSGVACGTTVAIQVAVYSTAYTATVTATNAAGTSAGYASQPGTSSPKALDADASPAFGPSCPNAYGGMEYCGPNSGTCPNASLSGCAENINGGTTVYATCWETGQGISGANPPDYPNGAYYYDWVDIDNPATGFMSELWFIDPPDVTADLPQCP